MRSQPLAAPSAFDTEAMKETKGPKKTKKIAETEENVVIRYKPGDRNMIINPFTGRAVRIDGAVGIELTNKYGYPEQEGGVSLSNIYNDLVDSFNTMFKMNPDRYPNNPSKRSKKAKQLGEEWSRHTEKIERPTVYVDRFIETEPELEPEFMGLSILEPETIEELTPEDIEEIESMNIGRRHKGNIRRQMW